ncbi:GNAT family N-acetyltransferase [Streptomyces sp. NRRL F-2664]|uniref:GNAT family N-acetyltransferase n=1 Tax=Streptomyces sp. NRRL F-2664 TaxID=1463842 RepID=UPI0004C7D6D2|nr:GNAT family N-acetyltransferase [Streptomyces sp. NRRL F-2664]
MEPTTLTTERLVLRPFVPEDAAEVYAACQDPEIQRWNEVPSPYTRAHADTWVHETVPAGWRGDTAYSFAVRLGPQGPLVAALGVHPRGESVFEVGFWAVAEHRGRGYVAEALGAAARWAFTELGAGRLEWRAEPDNAASRAVAEKAGFRMEGILRAGIRHRGTLRDCRVGALLPSDLDLPPHLPYLPARPDAGPAVSGTP